MTLDRLIGISKGNSGRNVADELAYRIKELIINGELPAGFQFPNENDFCEMLNIGRGTLREAYKVLESQGCIVRTRGGTFVNDIDKFIMNLPFDLAIQTTGFNDMLEFRSMFEAEISGLAAQRASDESIANLEYYLGQMKAHRKDIIALTKDDLRFHMEIAYASGNKLLAHTMKMAISTFEKSILEGFQRGGEAMIDQAITYHESILLAIKMHDSAMARAVMRAHVNHVVGEVLSKRDN